MQIPMKFQLPANHLAYTRNGLSLYGEFTENGNLPIEAKGIPGIG